MPAQLLDPVPKLKRILKRLSLVLVGLLSGFALLEVGMIVLEPYVLQGFYMYDRELGFRVRPNTASSNEFGFNDYDYPLEKPDDTYRILFLGDSFSWSCGRDDNYVGVLRELVKERFPERKIDVINAGYPMTHTGEQLDLLERFGLEYQPDLVVLGFFIGNDFLDGGPYRKRIVVNETFLDIDKRRETVLFGYPIVARSRVFEFIRQQIRILREEVSVAEESSGLKLVEPERPRADRRRTSGQWAEPRVSSSSAARPAASPLPADSASGFPGAPTLDEVRAYLEEVAFHCREDDQKPMFTRETQLGLIERQLLMCVADPKPEGFLEPRFEYILGKVDEMANLLSERGIKFLVAMHPANFQVDPELAGTVMERSGRAADEYDLLRPQTLLAAHLDQRDVPYIDLIEPLKEAQQIRPTYLPMDTHWNYYGNVVAAHAVFLHILYPLTVELDRK